MLGMALLLSGCSITIICGPQAAKPQATREDSGTTKTAAPGTARIQSLINVDFGCGATTAKRGPAAVGIAADDFWNFYTRDEDGDPSRYRPSGALPQLRDHRGADCQAGLTLRNAPGAWHNGSPDPMFERYLYPFDYRQRIEVTITNLPPGHYDVYLYGHTPGNEGNSRYELRLDEQSVGTLATAAEGWQAPLWVEGVHYVVFRDVRVKSRQQLVQVVVHPGQLHALIAGLQLARRP